MPKHLATDCPKTADPARYGGKNWSRKFQCPVCGRSRWHSLNFLGQGAVYCNGDKFQTVRTYADLRQFRAA